MYGIQFESQPASARSNLALVGCAVDSLNLIVDNELKVAHICPLFHWNGIHKVGNFIRAGGP